LTPKPYYGADGNKAFGITGTPLGLAERLEKKLGPFPFPSFWGPTAGLPATEWIARSAAEVLTAEKPDLTLVYLPHLDYEPQRRGPSGCDMPAIVGELDQAAEPLLDAAKSIGARVWIVSEYGHCNIAQPIYPNRLLRKAGLLHVRSGPFGEMLDTFSSPAFAVCDHQLCHVYIEDEQLLPKVQEVLRADQGIARVVMGGARRDLGLDHPRSGEIILLAKPDRWFAYPYWLYDDQAPDFARTVDIHRKPGFDPCEMFFDPKLAWPKGRAVRRLIQKKLGFRTLFDVVPLDASIVKGSHGLRAADPLDRPLLVADGPNPSAEEEWPLPKVFDLLIATLFPDR
jgi:predicted AlkP superfamily pyrophosphatase or phosphodiesterase